MSSLPNKEDIDESLEQFADLHPDEMRARLARMLRSTQEQHEEQPTDEGTADTRDHRWEPDLVDLFPDTTEEEVPPKDPIVIRGPMSMMVVQGPNEPPNALIRRAAAGVAGYWRVSASVIWYVIVRSLRKTCHEVYFVHPDMRDLVRDPNTDQARVLVQLLFKIGPRSLLKIMQGTPGSQPRRRSTHRGILLIAPRCCRI